MSFGRVVPLLLSMMLLGGCALLERGDPAQDATPPPPPAVRVEVDAPDELKRLLESHLDIARLPVLAPGEPVPDAELARLVAAAPAQARALLETEGYFESSVIALREDGQPPLVRLTVEPGPRVRVADVRIDARGPLADAADRGDRHAAEASRQLRDGWGLPPGSPFRNPAWAAAKNASLARLRAQGYARATWASTQATVDAPAGTASLALQAVSGPLYRVGRLQVEGLRYHDEETVLNLAGIPAGAPATERALLDYQERLQSAGLFDRASVLLDDNAPDPSNAAVRVRVDESPLQQATVGLGVSANVGPRISVEHTHRRPFGRAAISRSLVEAAKLRQAFEGELSSHPQPRFWRNLVGATVERVTSDTDTVTSIRTRVGRTQHKPEVDRYAFVELERAIVRRPTDREQADAVSLNFHGVWRRLDDNLLPTRGQALSLQGGLGHARATGAPSGPFFRAHARLTAYRPLWGPWLGEGRVEVGQVFKRDAVIVPDTQRFRAGGDESVRGYEYRSLAPVVDGVVTSGDVLFTASAEIARPVSPKLPSVLGAVFVDVGHAANRWGELDPAVGYGVGVRWRSPIGPLKVDLARGHETGRLRLHFTVGVTF